MLGRRFSEVANPEGGGDGMLNRWHAACDGVCCWGDRMDGYAGER